MKHPRSNAGRLLVFVTVGVVLVSVAPVRGQECIPASATIDEAMLTVWSTKNFGATVNVHRVTAGWEEMDVTWWNFQGSFDPLVAAFFDAYSGPISVDITDLVLGWADADFPNYGILLEQSSSDLSWFRSSETGDPGERPQLEIVFTTASGEIDSIVIKRPAGAQGSVWDALLKENWPTTNYGASEFLVTGFKEDYEKQGLIRFDISWCGPGTGTPGYWKNHPDAWPVDGIEIGGIWFSKEDAIWWMSQPVRGDKTINVFESLVAAKLNVIIGNDDSCIAAEIVEADAWMAEHPVGSGVPAGGPSSPWRDIRMVHKALDDYNNGRLDCADHR